MCLGFILPGVILGYGFAAIALLFGSSLLAAAGIFFATGLGVTLVFAVWQCLVESRQEIERPGHGTAQGRPMSKAKERLTSPN